jgi:hypothetical protein
MNDGLCAASCERNNKKPMANNRTSVVNIAMTNDSNHSGCWFLVWRMACGVGMTE